MNAPASIAAHVLSGRPSLSAAAKRGREILRHVAEIITNTQQNLLDTSRAFNTQWEAGIDAFARQARLDAAWAAQWHLGKGAVQDGVAQAAKKGRQIVLKVNDYLLKNSRKLAVLAITSNVTEMSFRFAVAESITHGGNTPMLMVGVKAVSLCAMVLTAMHLTTSVQSGKFPEWPGITKPAVSLRNAALVGRWMTASALRFAAYTAYGASLAMPVLGAMLAAASDTRPDMRSEIALDILIPAIASGIAIGLEEVGDGLSESANHLLRHFAPDAAKQQTPGQDSCDDRTPSPC